eukprot:1160534-Pelagomonas_calceolata.AAC.17
MQHQARSVGESYQKKIKKHSIPFPGVAQTALPHAVEGLKALTHSDAYNRLHTDNQAQTHYIESFFRRELQTHRAALLPFHPGSSWAHHFEKQEYHLVRGGCLA